MRRLLAISGQGISERDKLSLRTGSDMRVTPLKTLKNVLLDCEIALGSVKH